MNVQENVQFLINSLDQIPHAAAAGCDGAQGITSALIVGKILMKTSRSGRNQFLKVSPPRLEQISSCLQLGSDPINAI